MSETHQREAALFDAAMELPSDQRAAYLERACDGNSALRRRIEALLQADQSQCAFLDPPTGPDLPTLQSSRPLTEKAGDRIGRYKLLEQIGEGGCGVVYVAEQTEPVRRRVALKIVKLGMDTKSVIARFEAERQALALMDHPNIAKVFDAGATETGRPYFVMELVRGMKITDYCDEKKLSTDQRLDLFVQVCNAVQHAHQKGIIHRDLKPSNVLVTVNDGVAVPKVIDFGVAKATGGQLLTDKTIYTAFEQFIGTPAYMSPEQAVLTSLDIDTRSDIYALGVLLYELMTGRTPFDAKELLEIGLDEMRRTIREAEPPKPSTRVSALASPDLSTTAQRRGLDAPKLVSELRGDLDWIVMKCLEKDRGRRYETANGLAMDIRRHLDDEPVKACPPSKWYALKKTVQRHKAVVAATAAVIMALGVGLAIAGWMYFQERAAVERAELAEQEQKRQRAEAERQKEIAEAVDVSLREDVLGQADIWAQAEMGFEPNPDLTMHEGLMRAAERIDRFEDNPLKEAGVRLTIGAAFKGLGDYERAVHHLEEALNLLRGELGPDHRKVLSTTVRLLWAYYGLGEFEKAEPLTKEAMERARATLGREDELTLQLMYSLAYNYKRLEKRDLALPLFKETVEHAKASLGLEHRLTLAAMDALAASYSDAGDYDQAVSLFKEVLELTQAKGGLDRLHSYATASKLGAAYRRAGKLDQALPLLERALEQRRDQLGRDHPYTLESMEQLGLLYNDFGRDLDALPLFQEVQKSRKAKWGPDHPETLAAMFLVARTHVRLREWEEAVPRCVEAFERRKTVLGPAHPDTLETMGLLAKARRDTGDNDQALELYQQAVHLSRNHLGPTHQRTASAINNLAYHHEERGKRDLAIKLLEDSLELWTASPEPKARDLEESILIAMGNVGLWHLDNGNSDQALAVLQDASERVEDISPPIHYLAAAISTNLGFAYERKGELETALPLYRKGVKHHDAEQQVFTNSNARNTLSGLANLLARVGEWKEAAECFEKLIEGDPDDHWPYFHLATSLVAQGDTKGYRDICEKIVARFHDTEDLTRAEGLAKACLILPDSGVDLEAVAKMAAVNQSDAWGAFSNGLAAYRQEQFSKAVALMEEVLAQSGKDDRGALAHAVLAMAHHHLDQRQEARVAYAGGAAIVRANLPQLDSGDLGGLWRDKIIAHTLIDEANRLLTGGSQAEGELLDKLVVRELAAMVTPVTEASPEVFFEIVPPTSEWKWLHSTRGIDPQKGDGDFHTTFFTREFDDSAWEDGPDSDVPGGGFGYGDAWFTGTPIGTPAIKGLSKTAYFRHGFTTSEAHTNLELRCQFDDGIIIYLDGEEVARINMAEGAEAYDLPAAATVGGEQETSTYRIPLPDVTLEPGDHVLAISLHNPAEASSDLRIGGISLVEVELPSMDDPSNRVGDRSGSVSVSTAPGASR